jgi:transcription initiation factor TFIIIB Brf1 subunit/transcription initiation factor TFIIB
MTATVNLSEPYAAAAVTEVTIRNRVQELRKKLP